MLSMDNVMNGQMFLTIAVTFYIWRAKFNEAVSYTSNLYLKQNTKTILLKTSFILKLSA